MKKLLRPLSGGWLSKFGNYIIEYGVNVVNNDNINTIMEMLSLLKI